MAETAKDFKIVVFDPKDKEHLKRIIEIHSAVLPESFVVGMGPIFMRQFYYSALTKIGFLKSYLAMYQGVVIGMLVTNRMPFSLIRSSLKKYFITFSWAVFLSILTKPARLGTLIETARYKPDPLLKEYEEEGKSFEILTIGVVAEHRKRVIDDLKVAHHILKRVVEEHKESGFERVTGQIVESNKAALKFYGKYNATFHPSTVRDAAVIMDLPIENVKV